MNEAILRILSVKSSIFTISQIDVTGNTSMGFRCLMKQDGWAHPKSLRSDDLTPPVNCSRDGEHRS